MFTFLHCCDNNDIKPSVLIIDTRCALKEETKNSDVTNDVLAPGQDGRSVAKETEPGADIVLTVASSIKSKSDGAATSDMPSSVLEEMRSEEEHDSAHTTAEFDDLTSDHRASLETENLDIHGNQDLPESADVEMRVEHSVEDNVQTNLAVDKDTLERFGTIGLHEDTEIPIAVDKDTQNSVGQLGKIESIENTGIPAIEAEQNISDRDTECNEGQSATTASASLVENRDTRYSEDVAGAYEGTHEEPMEYTSHAELNFTNEATVPTVASGSSLQESKSSAVASSSGQNQFFAGIWEANKDRNVYGHIHNLFGKQQGKTRISVTGVC